LRINDQDNISAASTITPIGAAERLELLPQN
jgi:hypothetical protein